MNNPLYWTKDEAKKYIRLGMWTGIIIGIIGTVLVMKIFNL